MLERSLTRFTNDADANGEEVIDIKQGVENARDWGSHLESGMKLLW